MICLLWWHFETAYCVKISDALISDLNVSVVENFFNFTAERNLNLSPRNDKLLIFPFTELGMLKYGKLNWGLCGTIKQNYNVTVISSSTLEHKTNKLKTPSLIKLKTLVYSRDKYNIL